MRLKVIRKWKKGTYTIGQLLVDGAFFCNTLEDKDRGLTQDTELAVIKAAKVYGETAIPSGVYDVVMDEVSPKYRAVKWYNKNCRGGCMPRIQDVPGFAGILIHPGNSALDSNGCILVGKNTAVGRVTQSRDYFLRLYKLMAAAFDRGEDIILQIV